MDADPLRIICATYALGIPAVFEVTEFLVEQQIWFLQLPFVDRYCPSGPATQQCLTSAVLFFCLVIGDVVFFFVGFSSLLADCVCYFGAFCSVFHLIFDIVKIARYSHTHTYLYIYI